MYKKDMVLRTPDSRFSKLKDFPFHPHYISIGNFQIHYVDEGPAHAAPVLLLHGVPAWSYLYRHIITKLSEAGCRVIAPDLVGFGRSGKPSETGEHTYQFHIDSITEFISKLKLKDILLFAHDWGSLIGLRVAALYPDLFTGIVISNGMLPAGNHKLNPRLRFWQLFSRFSPLIPVDLIIEAGTDRKLDKEERRAYRAPFPSLKYMAGIRSMPSRVPSSPGDPEAIINKVLWESLDRFEKPFLTVFSTNDPITRDGDKYLQMRIPGTVGEEHVRFDAGHFIQEDKSPELADIIIRFRKKLKMNRFN
jgi:haloalkane dehalogenase